MNQKGFSLYIVLVITAVLVTIFVIYTKNGVIFKNVSNDSKLQDKNTQEQSKIFETSDNPTINNFSLASNYKNQTHVDFKCYKKNEVSSDPKYSEVTGNLLKQNRTLEILCSSSDKILVQSTDKSSQSQLSMYTIYPKDERDIPSPQVDIIKFAIQKPNQKIKVIDWLSNGSIIFTLFDTSKLKAITYVLSPQNTGIESYNIAPFMLEWCSLSFKGNIISLSQCTTINTSANSIFFDKSELDSIKNNI